MNLNLCVEYSNEEICFKATFFVSAPLRLFSKLKNGIFEGFSLERNGRKVFCLNYKFNQLIAGKLSLPIQMGFQSQKGSHLKCKFTQNIGKFIRKMESFDVHSISPEENLPFAFIRKLIFAKTKKLFSVLTHISIFPHDI